MSLLTTPSADGSVAGDYSNNPSRRTKRDAVEEFEDLLAYDWQDSRDEFFSRVRALFQRAAAHPALRNWLAERVAETAGPVCPTLLHIKLWPLAFLLGQDAHLICAGADADGYAMFLYRGVFYGVPAGTNITPELLGGAGPPGMIWAPTLAELRAIIPSTPAWGDIRFADRAVAPTNGPDVAWLTAPALVGSHGTYNIIAFLNSFWAVPQALGPVDLARGADRSHPDLIVAQTREQLIAQLDGGTKGQGGATDHVNARG